MDRFPPGFGSTPLPFKRPSKLDEVIHAVNNLSDFTLALCAMCMERNVFTSEELFKMESVLKDARRKLGSGFSTKEGIAAVRAAFRIEIRGKEKK